MVLSPRHVNERFLDHQKLDQVDWKRKYFVLLISFLVSYRFPSDQFESSSSSNILLEQIQRNHFEKQIENDRRNDLREKFNIPPPFERQWLRQPRYVPQERPRIGQMNDWRKKKHLNSNIFSSSSLKDENKSQHFICFIVNRIDIRFLTEKKKRDDFIGCFSSEFFNFEWQELICFFFVPLTNQRAVKSCLLLTQRKFSKFLLFHFVDQGELIIVSFFFHLFLQMTKEVNLIVIHRSKYKHCFVVFSSCFAARWNISLVTERKCSSRPRNSHRQT